MLCEAFAPFQQQKMDTLKKNNENKYFLILKSFDESKYTLKKKELCKKIKK